jgi:hippurate hydrolase
VNPLTEALELRFAAMAPELIALYEDLHRHPELSMQEQRSLLTIPAGKRGQ